MLVNETPVVLRHVYTPAMQFRHYVENRFGSDWHKWHLWIDYLWNGLLLSAIILADWEKKGVFLGWFLLFWVPVFNIYLCPNRIEKAQKRGLTNGDLGSFNKFNCAYDSLPLFIGIKLK